VSDRQGHTTFFPITLFGNLAEALAEFLTKGRQVLVEGRITVSDKGRFNVVGDRIELGALPRPPHDRDEPETDAPSASESTGG